MTHAKSSKGIIGLGALGRAIDTFIPESTTSPAAILFTVKAFDLEAAIKDEASAWPAELPFITLCNGYIWPIIERLKPILGSRPIRVGMTTIGSTLTENGSVEIYANNTTTSWGLWGSQQEKIDPSPAELQLLGLFPNGTWHDDIRPLIRQKWILNVVINSLGAAHRLQRNGLLASHRQETEELLDEAVSLAELLWPDVPWPENQKQDLSKKLWHVVDATSGNENSMARDVRLSRLTESEYLAGVALNYDGFAKLKTIHKKITHS